MGWSPHHHKREQPPSTQANVACCCSRSDQGWDGASNTPDWIYTFAPGINVGENGYAYVEAYGSVRKGSSPKHSLAGGVAYYLSDDTKLDFSGSYGLTKAATDFYLAIGFSFRAPTATKRISAKPAKSFARY